MNRPAGALSSPGEHAARTRIEAVFAAVDRLSPADLNVMAAPQLDIDARDARMDELERLAASAGRGALLDDAQEALSNAVLARIADVRPYPYGMSATGTARAEDQAMIVTALRDLVAVAVMHDRLEADDARALARPGLRLLGSRVRVLDDPTWSDLAGLTDASSTPPPGAPLEEDWVAAETEARQEEIAERDGYSPPGTRVMRRWFFAIVGFVGVAAALLYGLAEQQLPASLLAAGAIVALCWTFATWSPRRG